MNPTVIRSARPDDAAIIAEFNARLAQESEGKALDGATVRAGVERVLAEASLGRYFVAEIDGRVAGQMMITFEWSDWRNGMFWWVQSVYVVPEARRRGVFRAIFDHVHALARATPGVCGLRLYVEAGNAVAHQTYDRLGLLDAGYRVREIDWSSGA